MNYGTLQQGGIDQPARWFRETTVPASPTTVRKTDLTASQCHLYMLWIDGVGAWQVCVGRSFVLGAPSFEQQSADIALLANVSRHHATLKYSGDDWQLEAHHPASISGRSVEGSTVLRSGDQIGLAERVRLGFRIPSILSTSAVIDFESDHRPSHSVDGIILLTDHCLLGPRRDHHIYCSHWTEMVVLFAQDGELRCRSKAALEVDGHHITGSAVLKQGSVVTGDELRFRVEQMK
ncbi:MAG: FHA domain-containing protein [Fuerstiella sp.]